MQSVRYCCLALTNGFRSDSAVLVLKRAGPVALPPVHAGGHGGSLRLTLPRATLLCLTSTDFRSKHSMNVVRAGINVVFAGSCSDLINFQTSRLHTYSGAACRLWFKFVETLQSEHNSRGRWAVRGVHSERQS
jgi:hypothetical protein